MVRVFGYRNLRLLRDHWEVEQSNKILSGVLRKVMNNPSLKMDRLPNELVKKKLLANWKLEGIPKEQMVDGRKEGEALVCGTTTAKYFRGES